MEPQYLGDGVYFTFISETATVMLTTGHHLETLADNTIFLEPDQIINLMNALSQIKKP